MKRYEPHQIITFVMIAILSCILVLLSHRTAAYEWLVDDQVLNRTDDFVWYYNPENCNDNILPWAMEATAVLNRALMTDFKLVYGGVTSRGFEWDGYSVVTCETFAQWSAAGRMFFGHALIYLPDPDDLLSGGDMILRSGVVDYHTILHEFGHLLGLAHSSDPWSVMCGGWNCEL
jgi:hypothetical protein